MRIFRKTFVALEEKPYRNLWLGSLFQTGAMQMQGMARGFFVYQITGSPILLGIVSGAWAAPALIFGLFGGVMADRLNKKLLIQVGHTISISMSLFIGYAITSGMVTWQHLLFVSLIQGFTMPLMIPARQSLIPQLVSKEHITNAVALISLARSLTTMAGHVIAGALIALINVDGVYYVIAGMYMSAFLFTAKVPIVEQKTETQSSPVISDLLDGLRYVLRNKILLQSIVLSFVTMMLAMPLTFVLPIFAQDIFSVGPLGLGIMSSSIGLGSLIGAVIIASKNRIARPGIVMISSAIISGLLMLGLGVYCLLNPIYLVTIGFLILIGISQSYRMTLNNAIIVQHAVHSFRGRVMSINALSFALIPAGVIPMTAAINLIGAPQALVLMALMLIGVTSIMMITSGKLRRVE